MRRRTTFPRPLPEGHPMPPSTWPGSVPNSTPHDTVLDDGGIQLWLPFTFYAFKCNTGPMIFSNYEYTQKEEGSDEYVLSNYPGAYLSDCINMDAVPFPDCSEFELDHARYSYFNLFIYQDESQFDLVTRQWREKLIFGDSPRTYKANSRNHLCTAETHEYVPYTE